MGLGSFLTKGVYDEHARVLVAQAAKNVRAYLHISNRTPLPDIAVRYDPKRKTVGTSLEEQLFTSNAAAIASGNTITFYEKPTLETAEHEVTHVYHRAINPACAQYKKIHATSKDVFDEYIDMLAKEIIAYGVQLRRRPAFSLVLLAQQDPPGCYVGTRHVHKQGALQHEELHGVRLSVGIDTFLAFDAFLNSTIYAKAEDAMRISQQVAAYAQLGAILAQVQPDSINVSARNSSGYIPMPHTPVLLQAKEVRIDSEVAKASDRQHILSGWARAPPAKVVEKALSTFMQILPQIERALRTPGR